MPAVETPKRIERPMKRYHRSTAGASVEPINVLGGNQEVIDCTLQTCQRMIPGVRLHFPH
jgi:hypothetical protein